MWCPPAIRAAALATAALAAAGAARASPPANLLAPPGFSLRAPEAPAYALRPTKDGGYAYQEGGWRAEIAPDGAVRFTDQNVSLGNMKLGPFRLIDAQPDRPSLQGTLTDLLRGRTPPDPWEGTRAPLSRYHADPREACQQQRDPCYFVPMTSEDPVIMAGLLDLTDAYMRWMKQDPYRRAKARFLAGTQELRAKLAARRHAALLRQSVAELPARLEALWQDASRAPPERRMLLWLLWSEATDADAPGPSAAARAAIERFIRERLPRGSADAFTDAELARYGAASGGAFAPYGPAGGR